MFSFDYVTDKGNELYELFNGYYITELEKLRKEKGDPNYVEGWCIIDNSDYVKTIEDLCGLLIYGYDEHVFEHLDGFSDDDEYWEGYTVKEVREEISKYFVD